MPDSPESSTDAAARQPADALTDEEIVRRVLAGELASFELIMRRYNQRLFRVVRGIVGVDDEAEDIVQETYVRAYEHLGQFAERARFSTWLVKIAVHEAFARRKRRGRMQNVDFDDPENASMVPLNMNAGAERDASDRELGALLTRAVDELPDELRVVFSMRMIEGLDTSESAECLDLSEANVKVRLHRARSLLRSRIDAQIGAEARRLYQFDGKRCDRIVRAVLARLAMV